MIKFTAQATESFYKKRRMMLKLGSAYRYQLSKWGAETTRILKLSAKTLKKSGRGRKTGQLARNIGFELRESGGVAHVAVGTGVGGVGTVPYADIQDQGRFSKKRSGTIRPRSKKYLTVPMKGVLGTARNYHDSFIIKSKAGNLLIVERKGSGGIRPLFLLTKEVTLPPTNWFSGPMEHRLQVLEEMVKPSQVLKVAAELGG